LLMPISAAIRVDAHGPYSLPVEQPIGRLEDTLLHGRFVGGSRHVLHRPVYFILDRLRADTKVHSSV